MKITKLSTFIVPPRWLFLKIDTDEGISGWGEPILEGHAKTLAAKITELESFLIGEDPDRIEDIWQKIYRNGCYRGGPVLMSALSGIDMALWDIKGKKFNVPIYQLLGGPVREHIRTYRWAGGDRPRDLINGVKSLQKQGFTAVKFNVCSELQIVDSYLKVDKIVNQLSNLRDAVGIFY
jgi:galactonate dehydratase